MKNCKKKYPDSFSMKVCRCGSFIRKNSNKICSKCRADGKRKRISNLQQVAEIVEDSEVTESTSISETSSKETQYDDPDETQDPNDDELFIENLEETVTQQESEEDEITENSNLFFDLSFYKTDNLEIDSIFYEIKSNFFKNYKCNATIYTKPSIFAVKKRKFMKVGWIQFVDPGFQCMLLSNFCMEWADLYKTAYDNLESSIKKYFYPYLPSFITKIVLTTHFDALINKLLLNTNIKLFLYGKGLKRELDISNITNLFENIKANSNEINNEENEVTESFENQFIKERIDFAANLYNFNNYSFDSKNIKNQLRKTIDDFCNSSPTFNIKINSFRLFNNQYFRENCCSLTADLITSNSIQRKPIGELTMYYNNSLLFREFLKDRVTIPSILGENVCSLCELNYTDEFYFTKEMQNINNRCLLHNLIPRIEIRVYNFTYVEELFYLLNYLILHMDDFTEKFTLNNSYPDYIQKLLDLYTNSNIIKEKVLLEEVIRSYFTGIDSKKSKHMIDNSILVEFANENIILNNNPTVYLKNLVEKTSVNLSLKRIYTSICKNKSYFSLFKSIVEVNNSKIKEFLQFISSKLIIPQIISDFIADCNSFYENYPNFTYELIEMNNSNAKFFIKCNNKIFNKNYLDFQDDELTANDENYTFNEVINNFIEPLKEEKLPHEQLIGKNHIIKERSRRFLKEYSVEKYSKLLYKFISNSILTNDDDCFNKKLVSARALFSILLKYLIYMNEITTFNFDFKTEIINSFIMWFNLNEIKLFPLFTFTKIHSKHKNVYPWIKLNYQTNEDDENMSLLTNNFDSLTMGSAQYMEPIKIFNKIASGTQYQILRIEVNLSSTDVFNKIVSKYNPTVPQSLWEKTFLINREIIKKNLEKYNVIIEFALLNHKEYLDQIVKLTDNSNLQKITHQKIRKAILYFMFSVSSITCKKPGIFLKAISKSFVCDLFPIFLPIIKGKNYLVVDEKKFLNLYESLIR